MSIIKFFMNEDYRNEYNKDFSDKLEKEQMQEEQIYRESLNSNLQ